MILPVPEIVSKPSSLREYVAPSPHDPSSLFISLLFVNLIRNKEHFEKLCKIN